MKPYRSLSRFYLQAPAIVGTKLRGQTVTRWDREPAYTHPRLLLPSADTDPSETRLRHRCHRKWRHWARYDDEAEYVGNGQLRPVHNGDWLDGVTDCLSSLQRYRYV